MNYKELHPKVLIELLKKQKSRIRHFFTPLGEPKPGEWRYQFKERGQSFKKYRNSSPTLPRGERIVIYIQPMGEFSRTQRDVIRRTAEFMGIFFGLVIAIMDDLPLRLIPENARRINSFTGDLQLLTSYILKKVLRPRLPKDAAAYIAFTAQDLWPGEGWNFVFGEASINRRVGVWSINRYGDPSANEKEFKRCLLRTMKSGTHETGHIFSMAHCTAFNCNMNGANSLAESDEKPLACCPECMVKICWASRIDPIDRYQKMLLFCQEQDLSEEGQFYKLLHEELTK